MARANSPELNSVNLLCAAEGRGSVAQLIWTGGLSLVEEQANKCCKVRRKTAEGQRAALKLFAVRKAAREVNPR